MFADDIGIVPDSYEAMNNVIGMTKTCDILHSAREGNIQEEK